MLDETPSDETPSDETPAVRAINTIATLIKADVNTKAILEEIGIDSIIEYVTEIHKARNPI
jgi:hypothetical protein